MPLDTRGLGGSSGSSYSPSTRKSGGGHHWWDDVFKVGAAVSSPAFWALGHFGPKETRAVGRIGTVLASSPLQALMYPKSTVRGGWEMTRGGYELLFTPVEVEGQDTLDVMLKSLKENYKYRYGPDWEEAAKHDPLSNLFDLLSVLGVGVRGAALAGSASRLSKAGLPRGARDLWKESAQPGLISEGEPWMRELEYLDDTGELQTAKQPYSRSPLRRYSQDLTDLISSSHPQAPVFGTQARIARTKARELARSTDRQMGAARHVDAVDKLPEEGRSRLFWAAQIGDHTEAGLRQFREVLARELESGDEFEAIANPEFADWLKEAKKQGFGKEMLRKIDKAIEYKPDERYQRAVVAMQDMTEIAENVIADANGFTSLATDLKRAKDRLEGQEPGSDAYAKTLDEIHELTDELGKKEESLRGMFHDRRGRVRDWFDAKRYQNVPERAAWLERLTDLLGEEQAHAAIKFADRLVNVSSDPATYWRDRIGFPSEEGAEEFVARGGDALFQEAGQRQVLESMAETTGERVPIFYSPLQRWVSEKMPKRMPAGDLENVLQKQLTDAEYENSGLEMYFDEAPEFVNKEDFLNHLSNPLNSYNIREYLFTNADHNPYPSTWDKHFSAGLLSRDPGDGEYREIVMQLTGREHHAPYAGRGQWHWSPESFGMYAGLDKAENILAHGRYHIFDEDGLRKMLVDEGQSDWANELREAKKPESLVGEYQPLTHEERVRMGELEQRVEEGKQAITAVKDKLNQVEMEADDLLATGITRDDPHYQKLVSEMEKLEEDLEPLINSYIDAADPLHSLKQGRGVPPHPLGTKYHRALWRRLMREAAEQGVDEIIITDPTVQAVRSAPPGHISRPMLDPAGGHHPQDVFTEMRGTDMGAFPRLYGGESEGAKLLEKEFGLQGKHEDAAYWGRYSNEDGQFSQRGEMPGYVIQVTPKAIEQALKPQRLYQRQPDWNALPKGATELLQGGGTRVHIFKDGDISTWIHELGHVAIHDLDAADQKILDAHYAGGTPLASWKESHHENFARDWEQWVREGVAPTMAMKAIFERLSQWMKAVLSKADEAEELPDEIKRVFGELFRSDNEPDIFIPHRAGDPNLSGGRTTQGIPRAAREIGDRTISRIPLFKKNTLALMRSGLLNDDPRTLIEHTNRVIMLARANQLREAVMEMARPLLPGDYPNFETQYVVKRAGRGVDKPLFDALESADDPEQIRQSIRNFIDDHITDDHEKYDAWVGENQLYVVDKRSVDLLFKYATGKPPGAATKAGGVTGAVVDAALDSLRGLLLYANPGFYVSNMIGNSWMMATSDPRAFKHIAWSMKNAVEAAFGEDTADPRWERISIEMGRGPTSGGLSFHPEFIGRGPERSKRVVKRGAEAVSYRMGRWGKRSGRVIDDTFRVAAWRQAAAKHGFDTDAKVDKLLDDAAGQRKGAMHLDTKEKKALASIRDEAENLMLDFDSLTPFERTYLQRLIFLYPFIRASAKYPIMFAGERPITMGVLGQAGIQGNLIAEEILGPRPDLPPWAQGYARGPGGWFNVGSVSPFSMPLDLAESLMGLGQPTEIGVNRPYSYLNPGWQTVISLLRSQNRYGRDAPASEILRSDFPAPAYIAQLWGRKPSEAYSDRSKIGTLMRALRVTPFGMEEGTGE